MRKFSTKNLVWKAVFLSLFLILLAVGQSAYAKITNQVLFNITYRNDNSVFGRENGPIEYTYNFNQSGYVVDDIDGSGTRQPLGYNRNQASLDSILPPPSGQDPYMTFSGLFHDDYGLEDSTIKIAYCSGVPENSSRCWMGWPVSSGTYSDAFTQFQSPNNYFDRSWAMSVSPYNYYNGYPGQGGFNQVNPDSSDNINRTGYFFGGKSAYGSMYITTHRTCTPKNVCASYKSTVSRDSECHYGSVTQCNGVCIDGQCDPTTTPAANISTAPITPPTIQAAQYSGITFTASISTSQCKPYVGSYNYITGPSRPPEEHYTTSGGYDVTINIPIGIKRIYTWATYDTTSSVNGVQNAIYSDQNEFKKAFDEGTDYSSPSNATRTITKKLWPNEAGNVVEFKNEAEARIKQYGAVGRGDSFVLQVQGASSNARGGIVGSQQYTFPEVGNPAYFHYTLPSYAQCAPPNDVTPTIASSSISVCGTKTNRISWNSVPGADKYAVWIRKNPSNNSGSLYDGFGVSYNDFYATTSSLFYDYVIDSSTNTSPSTNYIVKVYAHNANGWNISNSPVQFTVTSGNCDCTLGTNTTIPAGTSQYLYLSATSSTSCDSYLRECDGTTGILSGNTSAIYPSCSVETVHTSCTGPDGSTILAGASKTYYNITSGNCSGTSNSITRTCSATTGELSGDSSYTYGTCQSLNPTVPTGLSVTTGSVCESETKIYWNQVSGVTGYRIYRSSSLNGVYSEITGSNGASSIPFIDQTATPSVTYYYKILAFNTYGPSNLSSAVSGTTANSCVQPTGSIEITRYGSDLSWPSTAPAGTQGKIDTLLASSSNPAMYDGLSEGIHTASAKKISGYAQKFGICYYSKGQAECNIPASSFNITPTCDNSFCSTDIYVNTDEVVKVGVKYIQPPVTPPPANSISITTGVSCGNQIDLSWGTTSDAIGYRVYRSSSLNGTYTEVSDPFIGVSGTNFTDSTPEPSTIYYYKLASFNDAGNSPLSSAVSGTSSDACTISGSIEITRYGEDLSSPATAPEGTKGQVDNLKATSSNPAIFEKVSVDGHFVKVTELPGYIIKMTSCSYAIGDAECTIDDPQQFDFQPLNINCDYLNDPEVPNPQCATIVNAEEDRVTKVAVMYVSTMGAIQVAHYGSDFSWEPPTDLPDNIFTKLDSTTTVPLSGNPQEYTVPNESHTIYIPDLSASNDITYAMCTYVTTDPAGCDINGLDFTNTPNCDGKYCAIRNIDVQTGWTTKVGIHYVATSTVPKPVVHGDTLGKTNQTLNFTAVSGDLATTTQTAQVSNALLALNTSQYQYIFDWNGDESVIETFGPGNSGEPVSATHAWDTPGTYTLRVKAVDDLGKESPWTRFDVVIRDECEAPLEKNCTCKNGLNPITYPTCTCSGPRDYIKDNHDTACTYCPEYMTLDGNSCTCPNGTYDNGTKCAISALKINSFSAVPSTIYIGDQCNLTYSIQGATSTCSMVGGGISYPINLDSNGYASASIKSNPATTTTKFTLTCSAYDDLSITTYKKTTCSVNPLIRER